MPTNRSAPRVLIPLLLEILLWGAHSTPAAAQEAPFVPDVRSRVFPVSVMSGPATREATGLAGMPMGVGGQDGEKAGTPGFGRAFVGGTIGSLVGVYGGLFVALSGGGHVGFSLTVGLGTALGATGGTRGFVPTFLVSSLAALPMLTMADDVSDSGRGIVLTYAAAQGLVGAIASQFRKN